MAEVKRLRCFGAFGHVGPHVYQSGRFEGEPVGSCSAVLARDPESGTWRTVPARDAVPEQGQGARCLECRHHRLYHSSWGACMVLGCTCSAFESK